MNIKSQKKLGFSLLEISLASLIVAVLLSLIFEASQILGQSRITSARSLTKSSPVQGISNLVVWYESTMAESFVDENITSGTAVGVWRNINPAKVNLITSIDLTTDPDTIDNDNNAAIDVGGANSPIYETNTINRLPAISFDNALSQYLTFDGTSLANSDYTVIVVEQRRKGGIDYFIAGEVSATDQSFMLGYRDATTIYFGQYGNVYQTAIESFSASQTIPRLHIFRFTSTLTSTTCKDYHCYQHGVGSCGNINPRTLAAAGPTNQCQGLVSNVGAQIGKYSASNYYKGDIGEIIIFNKYLNDDERRSVELYLSKKWGIDLN